MNEAIEAMCRVHYDRWDEADELKKNVARKWMLDTAFALAASIEAAGHEPGQVPGPAVAKRIREVIEMTPTDPSREDTGADDHHVTEADLKQLMRDPRYWKHQDPEIVERVRNGFRRLYDEKK